MATVTKFLAAGASARVTESGLEATEVFIVTGLDGDPGTICILALQADGIPHQADAHPASALLRVATVDAAMEVETTDTVRVTVNYSASAQDQSGGDEPQISFGAALTEVETTKDRNGDTIPEVKYVSDGSGANFPAGTYSSKPILSIQVPVPVFRLSRPESVSPDEKVLRFVGRVNSSTFRGGGPRTWLCTNITGDSGDNGRTYQVTYEFQYKATTWDSTVVFTDSSSGIIPADVDKNNNGNGIVKGIQVYLQADFGELNLG